MDMKISDFIADPTLVSRVMITGIASGEVDMMYDWRPALFAHGIIVHNLKLKMKRYHFKHSVAKFSNCQEDGTGASLPLIWPLLIWQK